MSSRTSPASAMSDQQVIMGLLFYPRGGSAFVVRYLSPALTRAGWSVSLAVGSLGGAGDETHAPTFFDGFDVHYLDYTDAARAFAAGGDAMAAPVPMQPSYEDRAGVADVVLASVPPSRAPHLSEAWTQPFREAGADRADVFHLHHLTPQLDAVRRHWPHVPLVVHLHGTELLLIEAIETRMDLARALGATLATMPATAGATFGDDHDLDAAQRELLRTTRWDSWRHGEFWARHLREQAQLADHIITVSSLNRDTAISTLRVDPGGGHRHPQRRRHPTVPPEATPARNPSRGLPACARRRSARLDRDRASGQRGVHRGGPGSTARYRRRRDRARVRRSVHRLQARPTADPRLRRAPARSSGDRAPW